MFPTRLVPSTKRLRTPRRSVTLTQRLTPLSMDRGASTAEYAVVILAAVALAGVLVAIMRSPEVQSILLDMVRRAFASAE